MDSFQTKIFSGIGLDQTIDFQGAVTPKLLRFSVMHEGVQKSLYLASIVSREEKAAWQAFQDVLDSSAKSAASLLHGIFGLDVISVDIQNGIRHFNLQEFSTLLFNHGRRLENGKRVLIRYGQVFCILQKRVLADWGKIEVVTHVEIVNPEKTKMLSFLKKIITASGQACGTIHLIHDLGLVPSWELEQEMQDKKLCELLQKNQACEYFYRTEGQLIQLLKKESGDVSNAR